MEMGSSGTANIIVSIGAIFLSFGIVFLIIEAFAMAFGHSRSLGVMLGVVSLVLGIVIGGAGYAMNRSHAGRQRSA
jgi:membrane-bound ClpP family serine protease